MLQRTVVDLDHLPTPELESNLAHRLLSDPYLGSLLEELAHRRIDEEHKRMETAKGEQVAESQGIIRGTRYFLEIRANELRKREPLDRFEDTE